MLNNYIGKIDEWFQTCDEENKGENGDKPCQNSNSDEEMKVWENWNDTLSKFEEITHFNA